MKLRTLFNFFLFIYIYYSKDFSNLGISSSKHNHEGDITQNSLFFFKYIYCSNDFSDLGIHNSELCLTCKNLKADQGDLQEIIYFTLNPVSVNIYAG